MQKQADAKYRRSRRQGIHDDTRQGPRGAWRVRPAASDDDLVGSRRGRRSVARDSTPRAAHTFPAGLCRAGRPDVFAITAHSGFWLRLSIDAKLDRSRAAVDAGAERAPRRILLG